MSADGPRPAGEAHNVVAHNHVSFDIKAVGECPACDQYGRVNWAYPSARSAASGGATDRDRLAAALADLGPVRVDARPPGSREPIGYWTGPLADLDRIADALLPVVDRIANARAAAELDAAADDIPRSDSEVGAKQILRDRAAALREPTS